ncbi:pyridoxal-phosphate dependent enzyme, partial [Paraburkholderia nodosa]|uniref:pyridoxal-phosphate dependent enzyme n=1 Tax=Paraburkholderia nodosa TaxID=392320 RepID=UPI001FDF2FDF
MIRTRADAAWEPGEHTRFTCVDGRFAPDCARFDDDLPSDRSANRAAASRASRLPCQRGSRWRYHLRFPALKPRPARPRMASHDDYLKKILTARVYDVARETELERAPNLSARLRNAVFLKREDNQPVFSFKLRGAYNKMAHLSPA